MTLDVKGNRLAAALARGDCRIGAWLALDSPASAEIAALAGYDWALIDLEHGEGDLRSAMGQVRALDGTRCDAVIRLPSHDAAGISRALDQGIRSLMLPRVETVDQARAIVRAAFYPPRGRRGSGGRVMRASGYGTRPNYAHEAEDEVFLILQLESVASLDALEEIAGIDGVGALFVGPADLAADMGHLGQAGHADVQAAVEDAIERIRAAGLPAGIIDTGPGGCARWEAAGVTLLALAKDTDLLIDGMRQVREGDGVPGVGDERRDTGP